MKNVPVSTVWTLLIFARLLISKTVHIPWLQLWSYWASWETTKSAQLRKQQGAWCILPRPEQNTQNGRLCRDSFSCWLNLGVSRPALLCRNGKRQREKVGGKEIYHLPNWVSGKAFPQTTKNLRFNAEIWQNLSTYSSISFSPQLQLPRLSTSFIGL